MVDTSLNRKYKANAGGQADFSPVPDGDYVFRIKEIAPWTKQTKTVKVIQRDENGNAIKDDKGNNVTETVNNCEFYNSNIKFEIAEGEFKGKLVFHTITTHPNMSWTIDNLLYALNVPELSAAQIPTSCVGMMLEGSTKIDEYTKTVQNKQTGIDEEVVRQVNRIKSLKPLTPETDYNGSIQLSDLDLGI